MIERLQWKLQRNAVARGLINRAYRRLELTNNPPYHYDNIYYCCTQKTASQWFKRIFYDPIFYAYSGLDIVPYDQVHPTIQGASIDEAYASKVLAAHLYIDYVTYNEMPKQGRFKTFFILRDPRDIVVSWYFSTRYSHSPIGLIGQYRKEFEHLSVADGLCRSIDIIAQQGIFDCQLSWMQMEPSDAVKIFSYESFAADNFGFLRDLLDYLEISIPPIRLHQLHERHTFSRYGKGRQQGREDQTSHYRKGVAGDWRNYFDSSVTTHFNDVSGDLIERLGYASEQAR